MRIITLNEEDFDIYASTHKYRNIYQTSSYAKFAKANGFNYHYLGFVNNQNQIIGATLIIYKTIYMNYKYAYAPNGFLLDYNNYDTVKDITEKLKKLLYKQKFMFFTIDPLIPLAIKNQKGEIVSYNENGNNILNILKKCNYKHKGFNNGFENKKARFNAIVKLDKSNEKLYSSLNKQTRNKISKANKSGIVIYQSNHDALPILYEFIKRKSKRKIKYYEDLLASFGDKAEIYLAKIEPIKYVECAKNAYEKELNINEFINEKIQSKSTKGKDIRKLINRKMESDKVLNNEQGNLVRATRIYQEQKEGIIIGGCIIIKQGNTRYLYIEGFNQRFREFNPNYLLKWELIKKFNNEGINEFNLNAINGNFKEKTKFYGLTEMKLGFSKYAAEYIGEFDLIINNFIYKLYKRQEKKSNKK